MVTPMQTSEPNVVAQVSNLLYRRFPIGRPFARAMNRGIGAPASGTARCFGAPSTASARSNTHRRAETVLGAPVPGESRPPKLDAQWDHEPQKPNAQRLGKDKDGLLVKFNLCLSPIFGVHGEGWTRSQKSTISNRTWYKRAFVEVEPATVVQLAPVSRFPI